MQTVLGIDCGTSSLKALLLDLEGGTAGVAASSYDVDIPAPGRAEQDPEIWWSALKNVLAALRGAHPEAFAAIRGIGLSGQMHGLVCVDANGTALRPAILWLDARTGELTRTLEEKIGMDAVRERLHNRPAAGFAFPSLVWLRDNEPDVYARTAAVLAPKDYLRLRLTGETGAERSDASATGIFDVGAGDWARELIDRCGINPALFPACADSTDHAGTVSGSCAAETGLARGIPVVYGAGDQPCQSLGNGVYAEGPVIANIGTGGQIACCSDTDRFDPELRVHTFRHALRGKFTVFGAALASGLSLKWLAGICGGANFETMGKEAAATAPGAGGLLFLPYLSGERTPHMDPAARGAFMGLDMGHGRGHLARAVMEGVTFSLLDSLTILDGMGIRPERVIASGGGAKSPVWLQIQADIFDKPVTVCREKEQAALGAAMLAAEGCALATIPELAGRCVRYDADHYAPRREYRGVYEDLYGLYRELYPANRRIMHTLNAVRHKE
ncbi:xylulokinase [Desulfovibrio sp. OttesenSCG-928-I05]|nr:xylulokinase [Desulfovibrio sp. OttesenSCG-928-I05]